MPRTHICQKKANTYTDATYTYHLKTYLSKSANIDTYVTYLLLLFFQKMNSSQFGFSLYLDLTGKARDTATSPNFQFCQKYCFGSVKSRLPTETKTDLASVKTFVHGRGRQWIVRFDWQPLSNSEYCNYRAFHGTENRLLR